MEHRNIAKFELCAFVSDNSPNAMAMILHPSEGEDFMITTSVAAAADIAQRLTEALQQIAKELKGGVSAPRSPELVVKYNAVQMHTDQGLAVAILLEGDRSKAPFYGIQNQTDARRFAALLTVAAESDAPKRAN